jgi:hypothetical protein
MGGGIKTRRLYIALKQVVEKGARQFPKELGIKVSTAKIAKATL